MKKSISVKRIGFAVCFTLLLCSGGVRAQSYVPVPYNFGVVFEATDDSAGVGFKTTDLSMDCLAANGYGQWTASYKTQNAFDSGSPGLFLLANALRSPDSNIVTERVSSTGIVSFRPFVYPDSSGYPVDSTTTHRSVVKCVANLKGRVRYVWPLQNHTGFYIEGFNECPANDSVGLSGINLEFASYPYNTTYGAYPSPLLAKDVIKPATAIPFNTIPMASGHTIVTSAHEADPRDWFDIAIDTTYLYVVWEEYDSTGHYNIWELNENLSTGQFGPPIEVAAGARRPTISVDLRKHLTPVTPWLPCFDVAYITGLLSTDHLTWYNYDGFRIPAADTMAMTKSSEDTAGGTWSYKKVMHARMLDATWENISSSDTTPRAIYAIVTDSVNSTHLVMHKIKGGAQDATAYYCDGSKITYHSYGVDNGKFPVIDKPIRAFVNPYDGENNDNFDEYHCMYQLARTYTGGSHRPLMIIHGALVNNSLGPKRCLNFTNGYLTPGTVFFRPDTFHSFYADPGLNTDGGDTDNYVGAVNQMGIHTHWRNGTQHYYLRDTRIFDENIEENTLVTEDAFVIDGTTHGGTYTPTIQPGKTMTLWSDRINGYGVDNFPGKCTLWITYFEGNFGANDAATKLIVGTGTGNPAKMVVVWNADVQSDTSSQQVVIKPLSSLDAYGNSDFETTLKMEGIGATMTGGTYNYPSAISSPAYLNLHGHSLFFPASVLADSSLITTEYDQDATLLDSSFDFSGLYVPFPSTITNSIILNKDTSVPGSNIATIEMWETDLLHDTISIINCLIQQGRLAVPEPFFQPLPIIISGGKFDNTPIWGYFVPNSLTIENVLFKLTSYPHNTLGAGAEIFLQNENGSYLPYETYNTTTISGCDFAELPNGSDGIFAYDYATDSDIVQHLQISGNSFNDAAYSGLLPHAAIELKHSEGLIADNTIEGYFQYGIIVSGNNSYTTLQTKSTICSNSIATGTIAGIATDNTEGYAELNEVQKITGAGHISGVNDKGRIIYSNYSNNEGSGIVASDSSGEGAADLTGIHSTTPDSIDNAAFDTIQQNGGNAQISLVKGANIRLGNDHELWSWTNWCQNNIITSYSDNGCDGGVSYVPFIVEDSGKTNSKLGNISHNFFDDINIGFVLPENQPTGTGCNDTLNRGTPSSWLSSYSTPIAATGFCNSADSNDTTWQSRPDGAVDCGAPLPLYKTKKKSPKTLSFLNLDTSTCQYKFSLGDADDQAGEYLQAVNELEWYVETCYDSGAAQAFGDLPGAVGAMGGDTSRFTTFREWLKTVLWLGPMYPNYYCNCAQDMYESYEGIDAGRNLNAALAVIRYLDSSGRCNWDADENEYLAMRHQIWLDTVGGLHKGDTTDFPEDTTLPTIDDLGLQILRGPLAVVQNVSPSPSGISGLTASENPFVKETTISFTTGEYAYISFQVFDVLGRVLQGDYKGSVQSPGSYSFTVDGTNWPPGPYYARITTPLGETRTIKLVKE